MKKFGKWVAYTVITLILLIIIVVSYVVLALPNVGKPEDIKIAITPARVARGEYLANHVTVCTDCHSTRDWTQFGGPVTPGTLGGGGEKFTRDEGFPGDITAPNISPTGLKDWTDGEILRAITCGVKKDGTAIFPLMPWQSYAKMDKEDLYSIIAYIRTLNPQPTIQPLSTFDFPVNILLHTMPQKASYGTLPDEHDTVKYGGYLVSIASCIVCHTKVNKGDLIKGTEFGGGREFPFPDGSVIRSANISPDKKTGIGLWTKQMFVNRFTQYADSSAQHKVKPGDFQTMMPVWSFGKMKVSDIEAIYAYLQTIKPISNSVVKFEPKKEVAAN